MEDRALLGNKTGATHLGFAVLLKFFRQEGRFPQYKHEVPGIVITNLATQVGVAPEAYLQYAEELRQFYQVGLQTRNFADMVLIKTLFYTGVRVSELVSIRLADVDVERCQIRITRGKGGKDRQVPFPVSFRELLALHMQRMQEKQATHLFESVRKKKYMDSGVRKMLER